MNIKFSKKWIIASLVIIGALAMYWYKYRVVTVSHPILYPVSDNTASIPVISTPKPGAQKLLSKERCTYVNSLNTDTERQRIIEDHQFLKNTGKECDIDCDNLFIQELYESFLLKFLLEDVSLNSKLAAIYQKIFEGIRKKVGDTVYQAAVQSWYSTPSMFPSNQKSRQANRFFNINPLLGSLAGAEHDPTTILLAGDFLKSLNVLVTPEVRLRRDFMFERLLKRIRGYRTNQKNRFAPGTKNLAAELQIGIAEFNFDDLILQKNSYYTPTPFVHPGRSQCKTLPLQGMFSHNASKNYIPIECGISGSTNYWIWTALFSGANLNMEETRLFLLSAFIVLGADGGHSLMEVLGSATLSSIFWVDYLKYARNRELEPYITGSTFAKNLYNITKNINPIGNDDIITIDRLKVADDMYNLGDKTPFELYEDTKTPTPGETLKRQTLESYFLSENSRKNLPFGKYTTFLDQIPEISSDRLQAITELTKYSLKYC